MPARKPGRKPLQKCIEANPQTRVQTIAKMHWGISIISIELTFNFHSGCRRQSNSSYNFTAC